MRMPDRGQQTDRQDVHAPTEDVDRLTWLLQNSESSDQRLVGSRAGRLHRARHLLNVLVYEPRSTAAILAFLCMAVIVLGAFPSPGSRVILPYLSLCRSRCPLLRQSLPLPPR